VTFLGVYKVIRHYYCASCDLNFSQVVTGPENDPRCPRCGSGQPERKFFKIKNSEYGVIIEERVIK